MMVTHPHDTLPTGLGDAEAQRRLTEDGPNEIAATRRRSFVLLALDVLREPMLALLLAGGTLYLVLGDIREAVLLLSFVIVIIGITLFQQQRSESAVAALRDLSSPHALVLREGQRRRIPARDIVRGDVVVVSEGERVPADGTILSCRNLLVDESLLTGESAPVRKVAGTVPVPVPRPGGDDQPNLYASTLVVQGQGIFQVQATGSQTQVGQIGTALQTVSVEHTRLQKAVNRVVRVLAVLALSLCFITATVYGLANGNWLRAILIGVTLAMALLPEEFPVVLTVFMALGAWRIAQHHVLTRRVAAIETLGATTVLCVDKTGTLTQNRMTVQALMAHNQEYAIGNAALPAETHALVTAAILSSQRDPHDPMERAIHELGRSLPETGMTDWRLIREYPLTTELLAMAMAWQNDHTSALTLAAKGAPEALALLCDLTVEQKATLMCQVEKMAQAGLRVLGVGSTSLPTGSLPDDIRSLPFTFLGLVGLADPIRPAVPAAIGECATAGIRIVMITGDYPTTAQSIARHIGLTHPEHVLTGPELDILSDTQVQERIRTVSVFARVVPQQKLRLVQAFKANGEVVAMTGDGVNDAPALKAADIGIAMGQRGTDVAREASALVLLDDDFASLVTAIRIGRRIFTNLTKAMSFLLAVHVPIAILAVVPVLLNLPLILLPAHIVVLQLVIDPACSLVFEAEPEEPNVMRRPPRDPRVPLFSRRMLLTSLAQGSGIAAVSFGVFVIALATDQGETKARALAFTALLLTNLGMIVINRAWTAGSFAFKKRNIALWAVGAVGVGCLGLALYVPGLRDLFGFSALPPQELAISGGAAVFSLAGALVVRIVSQQQRAVP